MNNENYVRVSLEKRLERLAAGNASTPQFSRKLIDAFCRTPIVPVLERCASSEHRKELCELLKKHYGWEHTGSISTTFGDLAVMIADRYLSCRWEEKTLKLAAIYFSCFDEIWNWQTRDEKFTRNSMHPVLHSVYDFANVSLDDYNDYLLKCGIPAIVKEKQDEYFSQKCLSANMSPVRIYFEMKNDALLGEFCFSEYDFTKCEDDDDYDDTAYMRFDLKQISHLIDFFVCPIASITKELYRQTSTEAKNNDYKGEKQYE